jgi:hypothetical protein
MSSLPVVSCSARRSNSADRPASSGTQAIALGRRGEEIERRRRVLRVPSGGPTRRRTDSIMPASSRSGFHRSVMSRSANERGGALTMMSEASADSPE